MKRNVFFLVLLSTAMVLVTAAAQNYYPAEIGNTWVLADPDGAQQSTYSLTDPEMGGGAAEILLKIRNETLSSGEADTDTYFLSVGNDGIELHKTIFELQEPAAVVTADFPMPITFFPLTLGLSDSWEIAAGAEVALDIGLVLGGESVINFEVVAFEDVVTPAGTFENCAKVRLDTNFTAGGFLTIDSTLYQWFAPNIGPVQYESSDGVLFSLVSSNLLVEPSPYDLTGDGVVDILDLTLVASRFGSADPEADVTGDGVVNILDLVLISQNLGG